MAADLKDRAMMRSGGNAVDLPLATLSKGQGGNSLTVLETILQQRDSLANALRRLGRVPQ